VAPPSGNIKSDRRVPVGFLLVFHIHRSSNSCRSQVIIDFQPSKIKPEVEISLCDATHANKYTRTIGRYRFPKCFIHCARLTLAIYELLSISIVLKSDRKRKCLYVAPRSGTDMTNRQAAIGFLIMFCTHFAFICHSLRVISEIQCVNV
jgi:hypothetical protein